MNVFTEPRLRSVLRIVTAFLFIAHGTQKLFGYPAGADPRPAIELMSRTGIAGLLEVIGGVLMLIGLFTRPVAFVLAGEMAFAYFLVHAKMGFWPILNHGELAVLFCFIFLYFAVAGAGVWSVDAIRGRTAVDDFDEPADQDARSTRDYALKDRSGTWRNPQQRRKQNPVR